MNDKLILLLRKNLNIPENIATDNEILEATEGTFLRVKTELNIALNKAFDVIKAEKYGKILLILSSLYSIALNRLRGGK